MQLIKRITLLSLVFLLSGCALVYKNEQEKIISNQKYKITKYGVLGMVDHKEGTTDGFFTIYTTRDKVDGKEVTKVNK